MFPLGSWKNIKEMEEVLTVEELFALVDASRRIEHRHHKFMAALKGVDLDENAVEDDFESVQIRAAAELAGKSEQEFILDSIGIEIEEDDD